MKKQFDIQHSNEMVTGPNGERNHRLDYAFHKLDPHALYVLAGVVFHGAQDHGEDSWRNDTVESHVNHAIAHMYAWLGGDKSEDHLGHAFCRAMFAVALDGAEEAKPTKPETQLKPWRVTHQIACWTCGKNLYAGELGVIGRDDYVFCSDRCASDYAG